MDVMTGSYILTASWLFCFLIVGFVQGAPPVVTHEEPIYSEIYYEAFKMYPNVTLDDQQLKSLEREYGNILESLVTLGRSVFFTNVSLWLTSRTAEV